MTPAEAFTTTCKERRLTERDGLVLACKELSKGTSVPRREKAFLFAIYEKTRGRHVDAGAWAALHNFFSWRALEHVAREAIS